MPTIIKKRFRNVAACTIGGKQAGELFLLPVSEDGATPADTYWRRRVAEGAIALDLPSDSPSDSAPAKAVRVAKASPSSKQES